MALHLLLFQQTSSMANSINNGITQLAEYILSSGLAMHWNHCEQLLHHFKILFNTTDIDCKLCSASDVCALIKSN